MERDARIGPYRLIEPLGQGGMGIVARCTSRPLDPLR